MDEPFCRKWLRAKVFWTVLDLAELHRGGHSLRQSIRAEHSLPACERPKIPNEHGPSRGNLCTARGRPRPKIRSLRPSFSKPLDFAILVRIL